MGAWWKHLCFNRLENGVAEEAGGERVPKTGSGCKGEGRFVDLHPTDIAEVLLLSPGAVIHGVNIAQRAIECLITGGGATSIQVDMPSNPSVAPPGWHLFFAIDGFRIPPTGQWIRLNQPPRVPAGGASRAGRLNWYGGPKASSR